MAPLRLLAGPEGCPAGLADIDAPEGLLAGLPAGGALVARDGTVVAWQRVDGGAVARLPRALDAAEALAGDTRGTAGARGDDGAGVEAGLDRLRFSFGPEPFASYCFAGGRRPYFWPVLGPAGGSVVRGQGTAEHPHHTGLNLAYGGHGEGGSTNIWSDWDEPPYGPGGRMVHLGWERVGTGPVGAEAVHLLAYLDSEGRVFMTERRRLFVWRDGAGLRHVDWDLRLGDNRDAGARPVILAARLPASMRIPSEGRVTHGPGDGQGKDLRCAWVAAEGPAPEGDRVEDTAGGDAAPRRHGIALLDHPDNPGFPALAQRWAVTAQVTLTYHPQPERPVGAPVRLRFRVVVHEGAGTPEQWWRGFAAPGRLRAV